MKYTHKGKVSLLAQDVMTMDLEELPKGPLSPKALKSEVIRFRGRMQGK